MIWAIVAHDFDKPLPDMGRFDAVISSFAVHHVHDERKRVLYEEIFNLLTPCGAFSNLEHVASPTPVLHRAFLKAISWEREDPSNKLPVVKIAGIVVLTFLTKRVLFLPTHLRAH